MSGRAPVVLFALLIACGKGDKPPPPSSGRLLTQESGPSQQNANDPSEAQQMFVATCAMCHGMSGRGDGNAAKDFATKPRDYTDPKWQASVTDEDIKKTIMLGGKGVGKSPLMPDFGSQLRNRPDVVDGLVKIIRSFGSGSGKPPGHP
jgi:cytochrome c553